jgi:hypothetical protein
VLLQDGGIGPAAGPIELGDEGQAAFYAHLIDAVLIAVERQQAAIGLIAGRVHCIQ